MKKMLKRTTYTKTLSQSKIVRQATVIDGTDYKLGRLASFIAMRLIGKYKTNYVPNLDMGDYVIVINALRLALDPKKIGQKQYTRYSGYQSGLKVIPMSDLWPNRADEVIRRAVKGMLPDNKLKKARLKRLYIFKEQNYQVPNAVKNLLTT